MTAESESVPKPSLAMEAYRKTAAALPIPSEKQIGGFVDFVSSAHSWYKHLPLVPPGVPFHFFMNPHAACDMNLLPSGEIKYRKRRKNGFHYSEWPTEEYLNACGHLDYRCFGHTAPIVMPIKGALTEENIRVQLQGEAAKEKLSFQVPEEILRAGTIDLTGIIHERASYPFAWLLAESWGGLAKSDWPLETGGRATFISILEAAHRSEHLEGERAASAHREMDALINPERQRLKRLMRDTVAKVLELVYGKL